MERIHHVEITVGRTDTDAAREFYCGLLGLVEVDKPAALRHRGGFWAQIGEQTLHVGIEDDPQGWQTKAHVAYQVADLDVWREKLSAAGLQILDAIPIPGFVRFYIRDPFGNRVEFIQAAG